MNNEPVAWMNKQMDYIIHNNWKENTANPDAHYYTIPLYTHPVKNNKLLDTRSYLIGYEDGKAVKVKELTLTNDEIREIGDECILNNNGILNWIEFARAILRKAQEK